MTCDHLVGFYTPSGAGHGAELLPLSQAEACGAYELMTVTRVLATGRLDPAAEAAARLLDCRDSALADRVEFFPYCPRCGERLLPKL